MNTNTVEVPAAWFENLLEHAKRTSELMGEVTDIDHVALNIGLHHLLGYISSAEAILKDNRKQP